MNSFLSALVLTALVVISSVPTAFGYDLYSRNEFKQRWIGFHDELTPEHLNRLCAYMETDAKTSRMLGELRRVTGRQSALELMAVLHLCADTEDDFKMQLNGPAIFGQANIPEAGQAHTMCLSRGISVGDALATFIHELTHYLYIRESCSADLKRYKDVETFSLATIQDQGEEVDAFLTEFSARIRIEHSRMGVSYLFRENFTDAGQFLGTREEVARLLLATPGYRENFSKRYDFCKGQLKKN